MTSVSIQRIASGGEGVGRLDDGITVFVPRTAPGDVADIEVVQRKPRYARARLVGLRTASSDRVTPPCRHYRDDRCGGCQLQHLAAAAQLALKQRIVGDALRRIGHRDVADPEIVASPMWWRYRNKVTLAAEGSAIGLHPYDRPDAVFALDDCQIVSERVMHLWARVREHRDLLPPALASLVLKEDRMGGLHVVAVGGETAWDAGPLARSLGDPRVSFWWAPSTGAARPVAGPAPGFPALAFEQVNPAFARTIQVAAVEALGDVSEAIAWDLYGGVGDTAALLAARGARVWTVDADRPAVAWGREHPGVAAAGLPRIERVTGRVEESLHRLPEPDVVVVNPPRRGLHRTVTQRLDAWGRSRGGMLAYVACDPATLARDLSRMPALGIRSLLTYDLFPQTSHVETLAVLGAP